MERILNLYILEYGRVWMSENLYPIEHFQAGLESDVQREGVVTK